MKNIRGGEGLAGPAPLQKPRPLQSKIKINGVKTGAFCNKKKNRKFSPPPALSIVKTKKREKEDEFDS